MEQREQPTNKQETAKPKRRRIHLIYKALLFLVFFFVLAQVLLFYFATPILRNTLKNYVHKKTNKLFTASFDAIRVNLSTRSIEITKLSLIPDMSLYEKMIADGKTAKSLYEIRLDTLRISSVSISSIFDEKDLTVEAIEFVKPDVRLIGRPKRKKKLNITIHKQIYAFVSEHLRTVQIKKISIKNGYFNLKKLPSDVEEKTSMGKISINLFNFKLDSAAHARKDRLLFAEDIDIVIDDYRMMLENTKHWLRVSSVHLSTGNSLIEVNGVSLSPTIARIVDSADNSAKSMLRIIVPEAKIEQIDFARAYFHRELFVGFMKLSSPRVAIIATKAGKKKTESIKNRDDFYRFLKPYFKYIDVDVFAVDDARFSFGKIGEQSPIFSSDSTELTINKLHLDSTGLDANKRIFIADNLVFATRNVLINMQNNFHSLKVGHVSFTSEDSTILAKKINYQPNNVALNSSILAKIEKVELSGISLHKLVFDKELNINKLGVETVNFRSRKFARQQKSRTRKQAYLPISKISIKDLNLSNIDYNIEEFRRDTVTISSKGNLSVNIWDLSLYPKLLHLGAKAFRFGNFVIGLNNFGLNSEKALSEIGLKKLQISSRNKLVDIEGFSMTPKVGRDTIADLNDRNKNKLIDVAFNKLQLLDIDLKKAIYDRELFINEIKLDAPIIELSGFSSVKITKDSTVSEAIQFAEKQGFIISSHDSISSRFYENNFLTESHSSIVAEIDTTPYITKLLAASAMRFFDKIQIAQFKIQNGSFELTENDSLGSKTKVVQSDFSFRTKGFNYNLDSLYVSDNIFLSDNIAFQLSDFNVNIPNSVYRIKGKSFDFNKKDSTISAASLFVIPNEQKADLQHIANLYNLYLPQFSVRGIDLWNGYARNKIAMDSLKIDSTVIVIINRPNFRSDTKKTVKIERKEIFPAILELLKLNHLSFSGILGYVQESGKNSRLMASSQISLELDSLFVDSVEIKKSTLPFDDLRLTIAKAFFEEPDSTHKLNIDSIVLSTKKSEIKISQISFKNDSTKSSFQSMKRKKRNRLFDFRIPEIKISGFDIMQIIKDKTIIIDTIDIGVPSFDISTFAELLPKIKKKFNISEIREKLLANWNHIQLKMCKLNNASLKMKNINLDSVRMQTAEKLSVKIDNFLVSREIANDERLFFADDIDAKINDYEITMKDSSYKISVAEAGISTGRSELRIAGFALQPLVSKEDFAPRFSDFQKSVFKINAPEIRLFGLDLKLLLDKQEINANRLFIKDMNAEGFKDQRLPYDTARRPPYPIRQFLELPVLVLLDTIAIEDSYLSFELLSDKTQRYAKIDFADMDILMQNITNIPAEIAKNDKMRIDANTKFLNDGNLEATFIFDMNSPRENYSYSGILGQMDMTKLNPFLVNLLAVEVETGIIDSLEFEVEVNERFADGKMKFRYHDLLVTIRDREAENIDSSRRGGITFLANTFIQNDNPKRSGIFRRGLLRRGKIYFEKDHSRPIFHYLIQAILSGVKSTWGIKSRAMKRKMREDKRKMKKRIRKEKQQKKLDKRKRKNQPLITTESVNKKLDPPK